MSPGNPFVRKLLTVRGTHDIAADDMRRHRHVIERGRALAARYGFAEIATPIFEFSEVFRRTLGDTSDVVTKEMYTFPDRGGAELTLRPENTAGVARALVSGALGRRLPVKSFYAGPMFRYERPQKGRLRQFHQIGVELMGVAEPLADVEVIALGAHLLSDLGVLDKVTLELNTLADEESRRSWREALVAYLRSREDALSEESRERLRRNPLRILDSKDEGDRALLAGAPEIDAHMSERAASFFQAVRDGLAGLDVAFVRNAGLVRGLDYYCHTAFEFTTGALGAQGAVLACGERGLLFGVAGHPQGPGFRLGSIGGNGRCSVRGGAVYQGVVQEEGTALCACDGFWQGDDVPALREGGLSRASLQVDLVQGIGGGFPADANQNEVSLFGRFGGLPPRSAFSVPFVDGLGERDA